MFRLILILLIPSFLLAHIAEVMGLKGDVTLISKQQKRPLQLHDKLDTGMQIQSASGSKATLHFNDGTVVNIGSNSSFTIVNYDSGLDPVAEFFVDWGSFKVLTGKIAKIAPLRFKVRTKTATIGVRGTYFAGFYKEGTLGVLYLGLGNGMVVSNDQGETVLDQVGDGVFIRDGHVPPQKESWNVEQSNDLLRELEIVTEDIAIPSQEKYHLDASLHYFYQNFQESNVAEQKRRDLLAIINASTPQMYNVRLNASLYHRRSLINNENYDNVMSVLGNANLAYQSEDITAKVGRMELETPLTGISPIRPNSKVSEFASWNDQTRVNDWWWEFPTNFEAAYVNVTPQDNVRFHAAYINKMRQANSNKFVDVSEQIISSKLGNDDNTTQMVLIGAQYKLNKEAKIDYWGYFLSDLFMTHYVELKYRNDFDDGAWYVDGQALKQDGVGSVSKSIDSWLLGGRIGVEYAGAFSALSFTQTSSQKNGEINDILTPFDGAPAFTNSYAFRNVRASLGGNALLKQNSAYGSGTKAYQMLFGYDFNRIGIYGLSCFADYSVYDKEGTVNKAYTWDADVSYFIPKHERWFISLKYSDITHADFLNQNVSVIRALFGVSF